MKFKFILPFMLISYLSIGQSLIVDEIMRIDPSSTWPFTWDIEVTEDNTIYVGNELDRVYFKEEDGEWTQLDLPESIESDVRKVKVDEDGRIWVATDGSGVHMLENDIWVSYTTENSNISSNNFRHLEVGNNGKVYGGDDAGLNIWSNGSWTIKDSSNSAMESDYIDVMGYNPTLKRIYFGDWSTLYSVFSTSVSLVADLDDTYGWNTRINSFYPDGLKMLIGTEKGLLAVQGSQITDLRSISGENNVTDIAIDSEENIWLSRTFYGLSIHDGETLHEIGSSDTIPNQIFDMVPYKDNVLLVGNRGANLASARWQNTISSTDNHILEEFQIYPSITSNIININSTNSLGSDYTYHVYTNNTEVLEGRLSSNQIDISDLPSGIYYIRITNESNAVNFITNKVLKL